MIIETPSGTTWHTRLSEASTKLDLRASLPGAFVYDRAAHSLRIAHASGMRSRELLPLALPASWLVNSPAVSTVMRRWALPPDADVWANLIDLLRCGTEGWIDSAAIHDEVDGLVNQLGKEPYLVEAVSSVLALIVPDVVPRMPPAARKFVLGDDGVSGTNAFVAMIDWFTNSVIENREELGDLATHHSMPLIGAQVLDRLIWFDSEGAKHFPGFR